MVRVTLNRFSRRWPSGKRWIYRGTAFRLTTEVWLGPWLGFNYPGNVRFYGNAFNTVPTVVDVGILDAAFV
jgi:hypothetical protein